MRNIPYWLNIGSILYQYGCATLGDCLTSETEADSDAGSRWLPAFNGDVIALRYIRGRIFTN